MVSYILVTLTLPVGICLHLQLFFLNDDNIRNHQRLEHIISILRLIAFLYENLTRIKQSRLLTT